MYTVGGLYLPTQPLVISINIINFPQREGVTFFSSTLKTMDLISRSHHDCALILMNLTSCSCVVWWAMSHKTSRDLKIGNVSNNITNLFLVLLGHHHIRHQYPLCMLGNTMTRYYVFCVFWIISDEECDVELTPCDFERVFSQIIFHTACWNRQPRPHYLMRVNTYCIISSGKSCSTFLQLLKVYDHMPVFTLHRLH